MKKMTSLKQQLATALSLAMIVTAIAVCGPNQAFANGKGRRGVPTNVQQRNNARQRQVIMANTEGDFAKTPRQNKAAKPSNSGINWGDGNNKFHTANPPGQPNNVIDADGWPIGHTRGRTGNQHGKIKVPQSKVPETSRKEFDKGYISPYATRYTGGTTVNQGTLNNLTVNGAHGNDTISKTVKTNHVSGDWNSEGKEAIGCRRTFNDCTGPFGTRRTNGSVKPPGTNQRNRALEGDPD